MSSQKGKASSLTDEEVSRVLGGQKRSILTLWKKILRDEGDRARMALNHVTEEIPKETDLLSILIGHLLKDIQTTQHARDLVLEKVRLKEYSITDFFTEVHCLETAVEGALCDAKDVGEAEKGLAIARVRRWLTESFRTILDETAAFYQYVAEAGGRGLCQMDSESVITYANAKMESLLHSKPAVGRHLDHFFEGDDQSFVRQAVHGKKLASGELKIVREDDAPVTVSAEIRPLITDGQRTGSYASFADISSFHERQMKIFERSLLGIIQIDTKNQMTYANPAAMNMLRIENWQGFGFEDIIADEESRAKVRRAIAKRREGECNEYRINITPLTGSRRKLPVSIVGIPVTNANDDWTGSIGILRDLSVEQTTTRIHSHIESKRDYHEMLKGVADETVRIVDADLFILSLFSADLKHVTPLLTYYLNGDQEIDWGKRWWAMTPDMIRWMSQPGVIPVEDLKDFVNTKEWRPLKDDPGVQNLIGQGFKSFVRVPVFREDRLVAAISFLRKEKDAYEAQDCRILEQLPLSEAVLTALYYIQHAELEFRFDLIKSIAASHSVKQVAEVLVDGLSKHYSWHHVSMFQVDRKHQQFELIAQCAAPGSKASLQVGYKQALDEGVLGEVLRNRRREGTNIGNVTADPTFAKVHIELLENTKSELCLPVFWDGDVRWLLNVEDTMENAFSEEERSSLAVILDEVGRLLDQMAWRYRLTSAFDTTSDALFVTDGENMITATNDAAAHLLGYGSPDEIHGPLNGYFKDQTVAEHTLAGAGSTHEVTLCKADGGELRVLMSGCELPEALPGKVFVGLDLTLVKRVEELELIGKMFHEIALQTQTPLSLVFIWLRRLRAEDTSVEEKATLVSKILEQLRKTRITFDRLALYDKGKHLLPTHPLRLNLVTELRRVLDEFPEAERKQVRIRTDPDIPYIRGDPFQISFVFQTVLSYMMRFRPRKKMVWVRLGRENGRLAVKFSGYAPPIEDEESDLNPFIVRTHAEMALGEEVIRTFVQNHDGSYDPPRRRQGGKIQFRIALPFEH